MRVYSRVGTTYTTLAGALTGSRSSAWWVEVVVPPVGGRKVLVDLVLLDANGSPGFPAVEVAPVSLTPDAMVPLIMPSII